MIKQIAQKLNIPFKQVANTLDLLSKDATVPFIARYRKEATGNLDEVQIYEIQKQKKYFDELDKRKQSILKTLEELGVLTENLKNRIEQTYELATLEDLYLPYKKKRKTKAEEARKAGLEGLAKIIMTQNKRDLFTIAAGFINDSVINEEKALEGARDIIAEWVSENLRVRNYLRRVYDRSAFLKSTGVKKQMDTEKAMKYVQYFEWAEPLSKCPSHRFLAMNRGEKEGILKLKLEIDKAIVIDKIADFYIKNNSESATQIKMAIRDSFSRLLAPSIENEILKKYKEKADVSAIRVFSDNLRQLLLSPPLGEKIILAIDPGYRTGCKIAVINHQGDFLKNATIYPHLANKVEDAKKIIKELVSRFNVEAFSIGNGTASRETEAFIREINFAPKIPIYVVNEAGASIYSASDVAREEFPDLDITVRGAISIGRRLQDPLAELVKIDPKSIGVGQYQHDVNQTLLKEELENVVSMVVNTVGVNLNTASKYLLKYVSGIGEKLADNIIEYRTKNGSFRSREELKKVKRLGGKAFEQSAGFLRIKNGINPLDDSAVHPESYEIVFKMAQSLGVSIEELIGNKELLNKIDIEEYLEKGLGKYSLHFIIKELMKSGLDIRKTISEFRFSEDLQSIEDVVEGNIYPGIVNNITNFGCFVDLGIKENGLIHISNLSDQFVSDPNKIVKLHQKVRVKILSVDKERKRIGLALQ